MALMNLPERIPTEIIQLFSASEAWDYRLVPYGRKDSVVLCTGAKKYDRHPARRPTGTGSAADRAFWWS